MSARQLRFLLVPPHAEYDAADQESLAQITKAQLVVQSPEHHERDDVARLLSPIQPAATALVKLLATRAALNPSVSLRRVRSNAPSRPSIRTSGTAFPACARSECPIPYRPPSPIRRTPSGPSPNRASNCQRQAMGRKGKRGAIAASSHAGHAATHRQPDAPKQIARAPLTSPSGEIHILYRRARSAAREHDMNAPQNIDPVTAYSDNDVVHWLTNGTRDEQFLDNIFAQLCIRLQRADIPIKRASLHLLIYHPQWLGPPCQ